ncbi:MAG: hypothetical protein KJ566_02935 [Nanoarchaeota archaeon]|nr:hypothetical protein [Nanoarchaeota archaeon]
MKTKKDKAFEIAYEETQKKWKETSKKFPKLAATNMAYEFKDGFCNLEYFWGELVEKLATPLTEKLLFLAYLDKLPQTEEYAFVEGMKSKYLGKQLEKFKVSKEISENLNKLMSEKAFQYKSDFAEIYLPMTENCKNKKINGKLEGTIKDYLKLITFKDLREDIQSDCNWEINNLKVEIKKKEEQLLKYPTNERIPKEIDELNQKLEEFIKPPSTISEITRGYSFASKYICEADKNGKIEKVLACPLEDHKYIQENFCDEEEVKNKEYSGGVMSLLGFQDNKPVISIGGTSGGFGKANHQEVKELLQKDGLEAIIFTE